MNRTVRLILWRAVAWAIGFAILVPFYMGVDAVLPDGIVKTALLWIVGAIVVTLTLGIRPLDEGTRPHRPSVSRRRRGQGGP